MFLRDVCIICVNIIVNVCFVNILVFNKWLYVLNIYYIRVVLEYKCLLCSVILNCLVFEILSYLKLF